MSARENILERIRAARGGSGASAADGHAAVAAYLREHPSGPRPAVDGAPAARFRERALALASTLDEVDAPERIPAVVAAYLGRNALPPAVVCWPEFAGLPWQAAGVTAETRAARDGDLTGITGAFCAIAETGTLMTVSGPRTPAATSLLPETHIAVVREDRIVCGMEEAWQLMRDELGAPPRAVNFISGPSRTADIEQTVTLGAHGPYRVHIILIGNAA